jgi:hypothetical protein
MSDVAFSKSAWAAVFPGIAADLPGMKYAGMLLEYTIATHMDYIRAILAALDADEAERAVTGDEMLMTRAPRPPDMPKLFADAIESFVWNNELSVRELVFRTDRARRSSTGSWMAIPG